MSNFFGLTPQEMADATRLKYDVVSVPRIFRDVFGADHVAGFAADFDHAILFDDFVVHVTKDATYNVFSTSFIDPFVLRVADENGDNFVLDTGDIFSEFGTDHVAFRADYSGDAFVTASWDQGFFNKDVGVFIFEDLDTVNFYDRIFNYAEDSYSDLFPVNVDTQQIQGFNARVYNDHSALGEKNGDIFFYDGEDIEFVGAADSLLFDAVFAGF